MKLILGCIILLLSSLLYSQDVTIKNSPYAKADEVTKRSKAFQREKWFYEQRMYPNNYIPKDAIKKAYDQKEKLKNDNGFLMNGSFDTWRSIGPTTAFFFNNENVTSRISTVKYDPNNPNNIYIGAALGGVWKSSDAGATWTPKSDYEISLSSGSIAIDPSNSNNIYYATGERVYQPIYGHGVLKSTNGGNTWTNYHSGLYLPNNAYKIIIRPNNPNQLLLATNNGLYRSTNGGINWTFIVAGKCDDIAFSPDGNNAYAVGPIGYLISSNGGITFTPNQSLTMGSRNHIAISKSSPNILYFTNELYIDTLGTVISVYKSTNFGLNYSQIAGGYDIMHHQNWYNFYIQVSPYDPNYVYVGSMDIWRTTDGGLTGFTKITNSTGAGDAIHVDQHNIDFHPSDPNQLICVNDGGIWKSTNKGQTFINLNSNQTLTQFYRIAADPTNADHIIGGTQDNGTQRTLGTINWQAIYGGDGGEVCFHSVNNSYILGETQYNGIFRSSDGGFSWYSGQTGLTGFGAWIAPIVSHPDSAKIFYTARNQVFKTTDWGESWFGIPSFVHDGSITEMAISKSSPNIMYATDAHNIFKSTDRGYNFSPVATGLPARTITSVNIHPDSSQVAVITFSGFGSGKIYKTTNGGASWINISGNLPDCPTNDAFIYYPGMPTGSYYIATDVGVFVTTNYGQSWTELADGLPNTVAMHLDYHKSSGKLRVATHGRGVFEIQLNVPVMEVKVTAIPEGFYNVSSGNLNMKDTLRAYLRNSSAPFAIADSSKGIIDSLNFMTNFAFHNANSGTYYLMIKHRNSIETWSKSGGKLFTLGIPNNYDFTSNASQAFGNNLKLVDSKYCIYSGDVNQNGFVDLTDLGAVYNSGINFASGYLDTDLTGDGRTEISDLLIAYNNNHKFVKTVRP